MAVCAHCVIVIFCQWMGHLKCVLVYFISCVLSIHICMELYYQSFLHYTLQEGSNLPSSALITHYQMCRVDFKLAVNENITHTKCGACTVSCIFSQWLSSSFWAGIVEEASKVGYEP